MSRFLCHSQNVSVQVHSWVLLHESACESPGSSQKHYHDWLFITHLELEVCCPCILSVLAYGTKV